MITYKIHLIRHGVTEWNRQFRCVGGRSDIPLDSEGVQEMRELAQTYAYPQVQKVYSSPMLRATQTAEILYPDAWLEQIEDLRECDLGEFDGRPLSELAGVGSYVNWVEGLSAPPGGESASQLAERIVPAFERVLTDMSQNHITSAAVVSHGLVMMGLLALCGFPKREMRLWATANGRGYTVQTSASMWMRDRCFEVVDTVPSGSPESMSFFAGDSPEPEELE